MDEDKMIIRSKKLRKKIWEFLIGKQKIYTEKKTISLTNSGSPTPEKEQGSEVQENLEKQKDKKYKNNKNNKQHISSREQEKEKGKDGEDNN